MKTVKQSNAEFTGSIELPQRSEFIPIKMTHAEKAERLCRAQFEDWAKQGTRPFTFALQRTAGGEYVSIYTEGAWKAFKAGWEASVGS